MVTVSVVIPVYNVKQYLERCLDSVLRQTVPFDKIIIVDDGSTDGCAEICELYALKNDRIQLIHKENGGLVSAWMAGLKYVNTSHICFIDSDDFVADDYLECLLNALDDDVDLVSMQGVRYVDEKHMRPYCRNSLSIGTYVVDDRLKSVLICNKGDSYPLVAFSRWGKIICTNLVREFAQYCTKQISYAEDVQLTIGIIYACRKIKIIRDYKYYYQFNPKSICNSYKKDMWSKIVLLMHTIRKIPYIKSAPDFEKQYNTLYLLYMIECFRDEFKFHFFTKEFYQIVINQEEIQKALQKFCCDNMLIINKIICRCAIRRWYVFTYILLMAWRLYNIYREKILRIV